MSFALYENHLFFELNRVRAREKESGKLQRKEENAKNEIFSVNRETLLLTHTHTQLKSSC